VPTRMGMDVMEKEAMVETKEGGMIEVDAIGMDMMEMEKQNKVGVPLPMAIRMEVTADIHLPMAGWDPPMHIKTAPMSTVPTIRATSTKWITSTPPTPPSSPPSSK